MERVTERSQLTYLQMQDFLPSIASTLPYFRPSIYFLMEGTEELQAITDSKQSP
jgi:hypothetical protein